MTAEIAMKEERKFISVCTIEMLGDEKEPGRNRVSTAIFFSMLSLNAETLAWIRGYQFHKQVPGLSRPGLEPTVFRLTSRTLYHWAVSWVCYDDSNLTIATEFHLRELQLSYVLFICAQRPSSSITTLIDVSICN